MHPSQHLPELRDKPAYIMAASGETVTYGQLEERSNQGAQLFRSLGLQAGDHVAIFLENNRHFFEIVWAAQRSGLIFTTISTHLKRDEIAYITDNCQARVFISSSALQGLALETAALADKVEHFFMVDGVAAGFSSWEEARAAQPVTPIADEEAGTSMLYSSGTTGMPKGILPRRVPGQPIDVELPILQLISLLFGFSKETVYLSTAPLYHAAPLAYNLAVMALGGTSVIMEHFDAEQSLALIEKYRANRSQWVPIMFIRMLKLPEAARQRYDLSSMELAIHAAAPCPVEIKEQMIEWWGPVIVEYYSATEGLGFTLLDSNQWLEHKGSVGLPVGGGTLHILDEEGDELPPGEIGTVYFEGDINKMEYFGEPEKTRAARNDKGWGTVGDVGYLDEDGYLYLTDRKNFMIISGGVNIYPQEIENLLVNHPAVADVAVFGVPDEEFGEQVKAVVQPMAWPVDAGQLEGELLDWCKARLSNIKVPRSIDFEQQLPRMDNGKLYKRRLRDRYWA